MRLRGIVRLTARVGTACLLAGGAVALSATGAAQAAATSVSNHKISGIEGAISCLTASRCVAVGYGAHHGQVVTLTNGRQSRVTTVASSESLYAVSCPSSAGCWAIGPQNGGANLVLVRIGSTGKVTRALKVNEPFGASIGRISCASMSSCGVVGNNIFVTPAAIEIGTWNGAKLSVHKVAGAKGSTDTIVEGIACKKASCLAVGYYDLKFPKTAGFLLTMTHGKTGKQHLVGNDFFYGASCVSASKCYTAGFAGHAAGIVVTVKNGVATHTQTESADVTGIECVGGLCRAAGEELGGSTYYGVIVTLANGTNKGTPVVDTAVGGFDGPNTIASRGSGFAAIGPAQSGTATEVATG